jgi:preprotein translocase subunit SecE
VETESNQRGPAQWIGQARTFLEEVRAEVRKVTWPSQQEYTYGTIGVIVIVALLTLVLGVVDFSLAKLIQLVMPS